MIRSFRIVFIVAFIMSIYGCNDTRQNARFGIDNSINEVVKNNQKCLEIFEKGYGVDALHIKENPYTESILNRFIQYYKGKQFERLIFLRLDESGEIHNSTLLGLMFITKKKVVVTRYYYEDKKLQTQNKTIINFDMDKFNDFLNKNGSLTERFGYDNMLTIDFRSNTSCECRFHGKINFNKSDFIDLSLFNQFSK